MVQITGGHLGNLGGKGYGGDMAGLEEGVVIGQLFHLGCGGGGQFLAAIADVDAPQARHAVDDAVAFGVGQPDTLGRFHDARALFG